MNKNRSFAEQGHIIGRWVKRRAERRPMTLAMLPDLYTRLESESYRLSVGLGLLPLKPGRTIDEYPCIWSARHG